MKFIDNNIQRCQKKLSLQQQKMKDCQTKEKNKILGDLITANLYRINEGDVEIEVENYYENMEIVKINLKPEFSPSQNAQRYYKLYQKLKNAEIMTAEQMRLAEEELDYLESVKENLMIAESEKDINELRDELYQQGYQQVFNRKTGVMLISTDSVKGLVLKSEKFDQQPNPEV